MIGLMGVYMYDTEKKVWKGSDESYRSAKVGLKEWQVGLAAFSPSYIMYHTELAKEAAEHLKGLGYTIHRAFLDDSGDLDGMRTTYLVVESLKGQLLKLMWHDSHQSGYWMERCKGGGWALFRP